jgi:glucan phosphorylase
MENIAVMNNKQTPKKHHYVPEFFIKNFSCRDDKLVFIYDKQHNNLNPVPKSASRICHDLHLYSLIDSGVANPVLEGMYSSFEAQWKKSFEILSEDPINLLLDNKTAKDIVATFIAFQFWRNPSRNKLAALQNDNILNYYDKAKEQENELVAFMERKEVKKLVKNFHNENAKKVLQYFVLPALLNRQ